MTYGLSGALCGTTPLILQWLLNASGSMLMPIGFAIVTTLISLVTHFSRSRETRQAMPPAQRCSDGRGPG